MLTEQQIADINKQIGTINAGVSSLQTPNPVDPGSYAFLTQGQKDSQQTTPVGSLTKLSTLSSSDGQKTIDKALEDTNRNANLPPPTDTTKPPVPPPTAEESLMQKEVDSLKTTAEKKADARKAQALQEEADLAAVLDPLKEKMDNSKKAQIDAIKVQYNQLRTKQEEANTRRVRLQETIGVKFGGRYAPTHTADLVKEQVDIGLQTIQELNSQENAAISAINAAYDEKSYTMALKKYDELQEIRKQRDTALENIEKNQLEGLKSLREQARLDRQAEKDDLVAQNTIIKSIGYSALNSMSGDIKTDIETIKTLATQYGVDANMLLSEVQRLDNEKVKYPAGDVGKYQFYVDTARSAGVTDEQIMSPNEYDVFQANLKAKAAAGASGLTPAQINTTVNSIAGAFDNESIVKEYNAIAGNVAFIKTAGTSPTDDISRVYVFAKVMDPNSVVREGEYATVQEYSQALLEKLGLKGKRIFDNVGFLTSEARSFMLQTLNRKLAVSKVQYNQVKSEYQRQIDDAYQGKPRTITSYSAPAANSFKVTDPKGTTHYFGSQKDLDAFKKAAEQQAKQSIQWK